MGWPHEIVEAECIHSPKAWAELLSLCPAHSPLQAWYWGDAKARHGAQPTRVAFCMGGRLLGVAQACEIWARGHRVLWSADGPAFSAGPETDVPLQHVERVFRALRMGVRQQHETWVVAPRLSGDAQARSLTAIRAARLSPGSSVQNTRTIDLTRGEGPIRAGFHQKWRSTLNASERNGLVCDLAYGRSAIERFLPLYEDLVSRKQFTPPYAASFLESLGDCADDSLIGLFCMKAGNDVSAAVALTSQRSALYFLGATSVAGREAKASYLVQWRLIELLIELGFEQYDLGGIDVLNNPGVAEFKNRMGGEGRTFVGSYVIGGGLATVALKRLFWARQAVSHWGPRPRKPHWLSSSGKR